MKQGRSGEISAPAHSAGGVPIWQRAAAVMVAGLPVLLALTLIYIGPWLLEEPWLKQAHGGHAEWVETGRISGARSLNSKNFLSSLLRLGRVPHIPDFSQAGLSIQQVSHVSPGNGRGDPGDAVHAGYVGYGGCHVSLWITRADRDGNGPLESHRSGSSYSWHADRLQYVLVSDEMRNPHFNLVAKIFREFTAARQDPTEWARSAMRLSAIVNPPCRK